MAAGGYGLQFQPGVPQNGDRNGNGQRGRLQEPVRVLSTRLPKVFGSQSIAPAPLLQSQGGMGQPAARGNVVAQALAQLAGLPPGMASGGGGGNGIELPQGGDGLFSGGKPPWMDENTWRRLESERQGYGYGGRRPGDPPPTGGYGQSPLPSPPPVFMPPPYSPPPPVVRPGFLPGDRPGPPPIFEAPPPNAPLPPVLTPLPQGPEPSPGAQPEPDWGNWLRRHHELNNRPASQFGPDNGGDLISQLAGRMFR